MAEVSIVEDLEIASQVPIPLVTRIKYEIIRPIHSPTNFLVRVKSSTILKIHMKISKISQNFISGLEKLGFYKWTSNFVVIPIVLKTFVVRLNIYGTKKLLLEYCLNYAIDSKFLTLIELGHETLIGKKPLNIVLVFSIQDNILHRFTDTK